MTDKTHGRRPRVSVIIPCFNSAWVLPTLAEALAAVRSPDVEVVFVDDGSTDDSYDTFRRLVPEAICLRQENRGLGATRNRAVEAASGEFLQLLDADDTIQEGKLARQLEFALANDLDVVYSDWRMILVDDHGEKREPFQSAEAPLEIVEALLGGWWFPPNAALVRTSAFRAVGGCDPTLGNTCEDFDLWVRLGIYGHRYGYVSGPFANYYRYENVRSMSRKSRREYFDGEQRIILKAVTLLDEKKALTLERRRAAARRLYGVAQNVYGIDREWFGELLREVYRLDPAFRPSGPWHYRWLARMTPLHRLEELAVWNRRLRGR